MSEHLYDDDQLEAIFAKDHYVAEAMNGHAAKEFLNSEVGRYIMGAAKQDYTAALLTATESPDHSQRQSARNRAATIKAALGWLLEMVNIGEAAVQQLDERMEVDI